MSIKKIKELLSERPFRPLIVYQSNGRRHMVEHPELAVISQYALYIFGPPQGAEEGVSGPAVLSYQHIASIEYLPERAA